MEGQQPDTSSTRSKTDPDPSSTPSPSASSTPPKTVSPAAKLAPEGSSDDEKARPSRESILVVESAAGPSATVTADGLANQAVTPVNLESSDAPRYLQLSVASARYAGPMPPPDLLRAYAEISPDLPIRMMDMAEKAQQEIHQRDKDIRDAQVEDMRLGWDVVRRGQNCGLTIGIATLVTAIIVFTISSGAAGAIMGTIIGGGGIATLVWAFRYDRKHLSGDVEPDPQPQPRSPREGKAVAGNNSGARGKGTRGHQNKSR